MECCWLHVLGDMNLLGDFDYGQFLYGKGPQLFYHFQSYMQCPGMVLSELLGNYMWEVFHLGELDCRVEFVQFRQKQV